MRIFAETPRLLLRTLEKADLPRLTELIGEWDVARWLMRVPHPYALRNAEEFYEQMQPGYEKGMLEFFVMADKNDGLLMGAIGLHPPRCENPQPGEVVLGYWLGKPYWGKGYMGEAARVVVNMAFQNPSVAVLTATTDPDNYGSQNVLRKLGFNFLGIGPRTEKGALRGPDQVTRWRLDRA